MLPVTDFVALIAVTVNSGEKLANTGFQPGIASLLRIGVSIELGMQQAQGSHYLGLRFAKVRGLHMGA